MTLRTLLQVCSHSAYPVDSTIAVEVVSEFLLTLSLAAPTSSGAAEGAGQARLLVSPRGYQHTVPRDLIHDEMLSVDNFRYFQRITKEMHDFTLVTLHQVASSASARYAVLNAQLLLCRDYSKTPGRSLITSRLSKMPNKLFWRRTANSSGRTSRRLMQERNSSGSSSRESKRPGS